MSTETKNPESVPAASPFRILKIATCPSLSAKSQLTYHIGCDTESQLHIRVVGNSGGGMHGRQWISLATILAEFDKVPAGETITSFVLHPLCQGSVNTGPFVFAACQNERLVGPAKDKPRRYQRLDPAPFLAEVRALIASNVELKWEEPVKASTSKTGAKSGNTRGSSKLAAKTKTGDTKPAKVNATATAKVNATEVKPAILNDVPTFITPKPPEAEAKSEPAIPAKKTKVKAKK